MIQPQEIADMIQWWTSHEQEVSTEGTPEWEEMLLTYQQWLAGEDE